MSLKRRAARSEISGDATRAKRVLRFPVVALGAEHLDLICIHPDPRFATGKIRVQVKSRLATDCDRGFPVKARTFAAFDYLIVVFLNVGYFFRKHNKGMVREGACDAEFYTFPVSFIRKHHDATTTWEKVYTRGLDIARFKNEDGFEQIARDLRIPYPCRPAR